MKSIRSYLRPSGRRIRCFLYRICGIRLGKGSRIQRPYFIASPELISIGEDTCILSDAYITSLKEYASVKHTPEIKIGNGVYIGRHAYFVAIDSIEIDDGCVLSEYVYITDNAHGLHPEHGPLMKQPLTSKGPVSIGRNCMIGFRACVMSGVTLGDHCVVGANSVVTRSFPAYSMVAGCPARLVKVFSPEADDWTSI